VRAQECFCSLFGGEQILYGLRTAVLRFGTKRFARLMIQLAHEALCKHFINLILPACQASLSVVSQAQPVFSRPHTTRKKPAVLARLVYQGRSQDFT